MTTMMRVVLAAVMLTVGAREVRAGDHCELAGLSARVAELDARLDSSIHIDTTVEADHASARLHLPSGTRELSATNCDELEQAIALVIAMVAQPRVAVEQPIETELVAGGLGSVGGDGRVIVGARWRRGDASIGAELHVDRPGAVSLGMSEIGIWSGSLEMSPCLALGPVETCATASAGVFHGSGLRLADASTAFSPRVDAGARLQWQHAVTARFGIQLRADVDAILTTTRFDIDHMPVWTNRRFEAWTGGGVVAHFP